jgi:diguanylate cyclase (GGDEF)-like protein
VLSLVLALAILNLGLGYVAALALVEPPLWAGLRWELPRWRPRKAPESVPPEEPRLGPPEISPLVSDQADALPIVAGLDELPADWLVQLAAEGIVAGSLVEATAHVLRLDIGRYRESLVAGEVKTRSLVAAGDHSGLVRLGDELRRLNQDWLDKQTAAADLLTLCAGRLGDHEQPAALLTQSLLDQAVQIRTACSVLESLETVALPQEQGKSLIEQTTILLAQAHDLRDRVINLLALLMRAGQPPENWPDAVRRDILTALPNRIGLEGVLDTWWSGGEQGSRLISAVVLDIDRFGRINQRIGTPAGDRALVALASLIEELLAKDRGFERLVRLSGQAFLVLLGDTGPHQALTAAERWRQTIEATTFEHQAAEFDLTVSCGVVEIGYRESSSDLVRRAEAALRFAKKAGRNRCSLDKGEGPAMIEPPQFPVKGRVIALDDVALPVSRAAGVQSEAIPLPETG